MNAAIRRIVYSFPDNVVDNETLAGIFGDWSAEKIESKTGIATRRIAGDGECSSDLGFRAARQLMTDGGPAPASIDFLILCTQTPDYFLPTTACLLQKRLEIPTSAGAFDYNLGCSGYIYGLGLAKGLIETGQAASVLLITAETYSKFIHPRDRSVRTIFGDAASATWLAPVDWGEPSIGPFVYGTDGSGADNLIVREGGLRERGHGPCLPAVDEPGPAHLFMNGPEIFNFTVTAVPKAVNELLDKTGRSLADIDYFVFHQANQYILEHLRKKLGIPSEKFVVGMRHCGNTVSSTIPIALKDALDRGVIQTGDLLMLVGFGVGYSWGATLVRWV